MKIDEIKNSLNINKKLFGIFRPPLTGLASIYNEDDILAKSFPELFPSGHGDLYKHLKTIGEKKF
jgi:hypothetical protein